MAGCALPGGRKLSFDENSKLNFGGGGDIKHFLVVVYNGIICHIKRYYDERSAHETLISYINTFLPAYLAVLV